MGVLKLITIIQCKDKHQSLDKYNAYIRTFTYFTLMLNRVKAKMQI